MILTCPNCQTRYAVNPDSIGEGREVRCAKCAHRWFQASENPSPAVDDAPVMPPPERVNPIPAGSGLPAPLLPRPLPRGLLMGAVASVLSALLLAFILCQPWLVRHAPMLGSIYHAIGLYDTEGLALADIRVQRTHVEGRERFAVSGMLVNRSAKEKPVPMIRITLRDEQGEIHRYWDFEQAGKQIQANETLPFLADNLESRSRKIGSVVVELGNAVQLFLR